MLGTGCGNFDTHVGPENELVMRPGDAVRASSSEGPIRIEAADVQSRRYIFNGRDTTFDLTARKERWYGSLGLYGQSGDLVVEEAQFNFATERAFLFWVRNSAPRKVYRNDGYVLGVGKAPNGNTNVEVYRVCIAGKAVRRLPGADDNLVQFEAAQAKGAPQVASYGCARFTFDPLAVWTTSLRENYDISRQVDFWDATQYQCDAVAPDVKNSPASSELRDAELVLRPGARLTVINRNGRLQISAPELGTRTLAWSSDNPQPPGFRPWAQTPKTITASLLPAAQRSGGAFGCKRLAGNAEYVLNYEEAQLNFSSLADFRSWLAWPIHGPLYLDYVYRNDGLLAGYSLGHDSGMSPKLNLDLFQICIGGKKPLKLPGAHDGASVLQAAARPAGSPGARYSCPAQALQVQAAYARAKREYNFGSSSEREIEKYESSTP